MNDFPYEIQEKISFFLDQIDIFYCGQVWKGWKIPCGEDAYVDALERGDSIDVFHLLLKSGIKIPDEIIYQASKKGNFDVVRFAYPFSSITCDILNFAVGGGRRDILDWLMSKPEVKKHRTDGFLRGVCVHAAIDGNSSVMDWCLENGFLPKIRNELIFHAVSAENVDTMEWLHRKNQFMYPSLYYNTIYHSSPHILEWLYMRGAKFPPHLFEKALQRASLEIIKWIYDKIKIVEKGDFLIAIKRKREIIEWLDSVRPSVGISFCTELSYSFLTSCHPTVLSWLVEKKYFTIHQMWKTCENVENPTELMENLNKEGLL